MSRGALATADAGRDYPAAAAQLPDRRPSAWEIGELRSTANAAAYQLQQLVECLRELGRSPCLLLVDEVTGKVVEQPITQLEQALAELADDASRQLRRWRRRDGQ